MKNKKINYPPPAKTPVGGGITYVVDSESVEFNIDENGELSAKATGQNSLYKSYVAIISQLGTEAPTAIVLQNDFDTEFVYNYGSTGKYFITTAIDVFKENKTVIFNSGGSGFNAIMAYAFIDGKTLGFGNLALAQDIPALGDGFSGTSLEIRVYN